MLGRSREATTIESRAESTKYMFRDTESIAMENAASKETTNFS